MSALAVVEADEAADPIAEARSRLKEAMASRARAVKALEAARAASGRARALTADLSAAVEKHAGVARRVTTRRTEDLKAQLKAGKSASFEDIAEVPAIEAKRLEAESRRDAAKAALEELQRDEAAAENELQRLTAAVPLAIKAVVRAHADELAGQILSLEAEAQDLHERIGVFGAASFIAAFLKPENGSELHSVMTGQYGN
jgi:chromosome segregation ATPase